MKTRPHKIQCAALILLAASMTSPVFPRHQSRPDRAVPQGLAGFRENKATGAATTAGTASGLRLPLSFEKNRGQAEGDVEFVGRGDGMALFLKPDEAVLALQDRRQPLTGRNAADVTPSNDEACRAFRISMTLDGANSAPVISGVEKQEARANYFIGADPVKWIRGVETYSGVSYSGVYPGIDLLFYGSEQQLEYDFTVDPGADPEQIRLRFGGADNLELSGDGALIIHLTAGDVTHDPPVAYQDVDGVILSVPAAFKRRPNGSIGFEIGNYDQTRTLVIDPVLVYSSYIGGTAADSCRGVTLDSAGNAYLVGDSVSSDFLRNASAGNSDVFVGKLNRNGLLLTYTFFGGSKDDSSTGLAVDPSGNIYLCGITLSPDFPTFNSVSSVLMGPEDAFVVKLTPTADQFFYSTLLGGSLQESAVRVAADGSGSAYVTGRTNSTDFPVVGAIQPVYGGGDSDAFVSKLSPDGASLVYSTFLGGSGAENQADRTGICVDASGSAYVIGDTFSSDFPVKNALRSAKTGPASSTDGFVTKIDSSGSDVVYSTYLGGSGDDFPSGIATDQSGNAYVAGATTSPSFTGSTSTRSATVTRDAFVAKFNPTGSALTYLTFVGGSGDDLANAIAVDPLSNAVIAGTAGDGIATIKAIQSFSRGGSDAFVAKLDSGGAVTFSTYFGGSGSDTAEAVAIDADGTIFIAGTTDSTDLVAFVPLRGANAGGRDIFFARIDPNTNPNRPVLLQAVISGKHLLLYGQAFDDGAVLRVNDEPVKTRNDDPDPTQVLFAKKAAKRIGAGQTVQLQIENPNGKRSNFLFLTKPQ